MGQGINRGPRAGVQERCKRLLHDTAQRHGCTVSLVGWSLGGVFAREMAKESPALSRCVITLGTPFGHPRATNAWRLYEALSGLSVDDSADLDRIRALPEVPTTSIYSKTDGIVAWQCSINDEGERAENVEVRATHFGMAMNPLALYAIADRLQQPPGRWQRFDARGARRWFFRTTGHAPLMAAAAA